MRIIRNAAVIIGTGAFVLAGAGAASAEPDGNSSLGGGGGADLAIQINGPDSGGPQMGKCQVTVTNNGEEAAENVEVTVRSLGPAAQQSFAEIDAGASESYYSECGFVSFATVTPLDSNPLDNFASTFS